MKVEWITWNESQNHIESPIGFAGGFFDHGMRWEDYIKEYSYSIYQPYFNALRKNIIENKIMKAGNEHQDNNCAGVPLFSDNTVAQFTYRGWGDFMAAVWSSELDKDFSYLNFYMENWNDDYLKEVGLKPKGD